MTELKECLLKRVISSGNTKDNQIRNEIPLNTKNSYTCGRSRENDIICRSTLVSRKHCCFFRIVDKLYIQDLKSSNGIFINGEKQKPQIMVQLQDKDVIGIGINELESSNPEKFIYQLHKQVVIDLEQELVKREIEYSHCEDEDYQTPSKFLKISESSSQIAVQNIKNAGETTFKNKTPSRSFQSKSSTSSSFEISFEISVNNGYNGPLPNVFVNQTPLNLSSNRIQLPIEPAITKKQLQNEVIFQELENVITIPEDNNVTSSSTAFSSVNKNITVKNSSFKISEISRRKLFPPITDIYKESSSSEKEVSTTRISVEPQEYEEPKEAAQTQMYQQNPDSTNAENDKSVSNSSANDTDSDTSTALCTSTTKKTSRSNITEEKQNKDVNSDLESSEKRSFTEVKNASCERKEVLTHIHKNSDSEKEKESPRATDPKNLGKEKSKNERQDFKLKKSEVKKIANNAKTKFKFKHSDKIEEEKDFDESFKLCLSDEGGNEVQENSNLNILSAEIDWLQRANDFFVKNAIIKDSDQVENSEVTPARNVDPKTCKRTREEEHNETDFNTNIEVRQGEYNAAWEKAILSLNDTLNQNVTFTSNPNPFPNSQFPYPIYPNLCPKPQNLYLNNYKMPLLNDQFPYLNYQMHDHPNLSQSYQNPFLNCTPQCSNDQIPCPVPYPNPETPQSSNNQSLGDYSSDLSQSDSKNTIEEKNKTFEKFSASWYNKTVDKTHQVERVEFKNRKATPKVISSERVNLIYKPNFKSQLQVDNNLGAGKTLVQETTPKVIPCGIQKHSTILKPLNLYSPKPQMSEPDNTLKNDKGHVQETLSMKKMKPFVVPQPAMELGPLYTFSPNARSPEENNNFKTNEILVQESVMKFQPDIKKLGELATYIPADKLFRSGAKSDEVLFNIVSWRPAEFESCFSKDVPCLLNPEDLRKMQLVYSDFEDYCKIQIPLILVNISYKIKNAYKVTKERPTFMNCEILKSSASIIWIEDTKDSYMMGFSIKVCGSKLNSHKLPTIGDFLRLEITKGDTNFRTLMFAYVAKILEKEENKADPGSLTMTFGVVTKKIDFNLYRSKVKELSLIMSLLPSINLVKALEKFKESPLLPLILNPEADDYKVTKHMNPDLKVLLQTSSTPELSKELNYTQLSAVRKIADVAIRRESKVVLIEGSPGTGKTRVITDTIIEILNGQNYNQEKNRTMKILVCGGCDSEIDEILHRLYDKRKNMQKNKMLKMVRVGLLDQMSPRAKDFSLQELAKKHVETNLRDLSTKELSTSLGQQLKQLHDQINAMQEEVETKNNKNAVLRQVLLTTYLDMKRSGRNIADIYPDEYAHLMEVAEHTILLGANVIICTLDMCYSPRMELAFRAENLIPVLIVEGAAQTLETDIMKPLTFGIQTLILVGDPCKRSTKYLNFPILESHGFSASLFSRLRMNLVDSVDSPIIKLNIQYRMNRKIAYFPNLFFHGKKVKNEVQSGQAFPLISYRVFNLDPVDNFEENEPSFVANLMQCIMLHAGLKNTPNSLKIGVIAASNSSKLRIKTAIADQLELISETKRNCVSIDVDTIQKFKNQERDVIFASCHRPKDGQRLVDCQRLYSIITLAKHSLILYGEFRKFKDEELSLWNGLIDDAKQRNMFVNIEARPHPSKLKLHVLRY